MSMLEEFQKPEETVGAVGNVIERTTASVWIEKHQAELIDTLSIMEVLWVKTAISGYHKIV